MLDCLDFTKNYLLFLDIDGTLSEFHIDPKASYIPCSTLDTLRQLQILKTPLCLVTGRSVVEAKRLVSPLDLSIAGTHGLEIGLSEEYKTALTQLPQLIIDKTFVNKIYQAIYNQCIALQVQELYIERKPYSIALHYRQYPYLAKKAKEIMQSVNTQFPEWRLKSGKFVWELAPKQADKGEAILKLLALMNHQTYCPIFIGDDVTDESGFLVMQTIGGIGIKVGEGATKAHYRLNDVSAVSDWLKGFLTFRQLQSG